MSSRHMYSTTAVLPIKTMPYYFHLMGVTLQAKINISHMCTAAVTNHMKQKAVGLREGTVHQFCPVMSRFKHSAEGSNGLSTKRPPQSHSVVSK